MPQAIPLITLPICHAWGAQYSGKHALLVILMVGVVGEVHGIATDSRPTATMSRARGPDCASSTPSMHHARDKPGVGHQWLPQHAAGVLLHERPDGRMRPAARGRTSACTCTLAAFPTLSRWMSSVHMPATLAERVVHLQLFHWDVVQHADGITRRGLRRN